MTFTEQLVGFKTLVARSRSVSRRFTSGHWRLDAILASAPVLRFDDRAKIILLSDAHRGDKRDGDVFMGNEELFLNTLSHYYRAGFTCIELGDGDDLWQTGSFGAIEQAYPRVFALYHQFKRQDRLHFILGNHEVQGRQYYCARKGDWLVDEGLVLEYRHAGQRILAVHGHQVDFWCDQFSLLTQQLAWFMGSTVGQIASTTAERVAPFGTLYTRIAQSWERWYANQQLKQIGWMLDWANSRQQPVIAGHTHLPMFPAPGHPAYFNTGSCSTPGYITGIEIQDGVIRLVKWFKTGSEQLQRSFLSPARRLRSLFK